MPDRARPCRLCVALDFSEKGAILEAARRISGAVDLVKIGLEAFVSCGPDLVREAAAAAHAPVFLDLKLHDIPNTVAGAIAAAARTGAAILNVHAAGGAEMMKAAGDSARAAAAKTGLPVPQVIAVTVLTSLDAAALDAIGYAAAPREAALRLALLARCAGLDGVVCSPEEAAAIRAAAGEDFLLVVPGIRPAGSAAGDQKRIATPASAVAAGADVLVVGRPITQAPDPAAAARAIRDEMAFG